MKHTRARKNFGAAARWGGALALAAAIATPAALHAGRDRFDDDRDRPGLQDRDDHGRSDRDWDDGRVGQTDTPIRHLVVIFQENVSFDHYFATYPQAANTDGPSFTAKPGTPLVNDMFAGGLLDHNGNSTQPFRLSSSQAVTCDQDHNYKDEQRAFDAGLMDRFPETVGVGPCSQPDYGHGKGLVMGYYDGNTVTALWNYAQNFAMSDNSYSTTFGPSTPGAVNLVSGQTHGAIVTSGSASGNVTAIDPITQVGSVIGDPRPDPSFDDCTLKGPRTYIKMTGPNVGDLLNAHHVTWGWFQGGFRPAAPPMGAPANPPGTFSSPGPDGTVICGSAHAGLPGAGTSYDYIPHHEPFQYYQQTANPKHLPPSHASMIGRTDQANHQYDLQDFWTALDGGRLPAVSFLKAAAYQDGHAGYSDPIDEQTFLVNTINRLMDSPQWEHMAIVILYDDSDGWYDHQMGPIVRQSNTPDDALLGGNNCGTPAAGAFEGTCGYGPRQPFLVISPWAKRNFVDHTLTDQSSVLRFIEDNWDLGRLGNQSSDAFAGTILHMFDFNEHHARAPKLILQSDGTP